MQHNIRYAPISFVMGKHNHMQKTLFALLKIHLDVALNHQKLKIIVQANVNIDVVQNHQSMLTLEKYKCIDVPLSNGCWGWTMVTHLEFNER